jgi:hypothetical protein
MLLHRLSRQTQVRPLSRLRGRVGVGVLPHAPCASFWTPWDQRGFEALPGTSALP